MGVDMNTGVQRSGYQSLIKLLDTLNEAENTADASKVKNVLSGVNLTMRGAVTAVNSMTAADVINLIDRYFETLKKTAENIAPSEEEMRMAEERAKELRQIQDDLREQKIDVEEAMKRLQNIIDQMSEMRVFEENSVKAKGQGFV